MKKTITALITCAIIQCTADETFTAFSKDGNPFDLSQKTDNSRWFSSSLKKYVSLDLTSIPALEGIVNVGIRNEADINGNDFGVGFGKGKNTTFLQAYGSWLRYFDASENAKYYAGIGLKGAHIWGSFKGKSSTLLAHGLFSAGRSFSAKSLNQFFEFNLGWPTIYVQSGTYGHGWEKQYFYSGAQLGLRRVQFALLYGLFF